MAEFSYLSLKKCACCSLRMDKLPRRDVRRVKENDLVDLLNTVKPIVLTNKRKAMDSTQINIGDFVCNNCRNFAKRFKWLYICLKSM
jgi:hypothetical protein